MKTYKGGCHCGKVRFEVETDLEKVIECNCSHCDMRGLILTFVPAEQFKLLSGEEDLKEYLFHKKKIQHMLCTECGIEPFGKGQKSDGEPTVAVNVRCIDDLDRSTLTITPVDGKSF